MDDVLSRIIRLPATERNTLLNDAATEIGFLRDKVRSLQNMVEEARREARAAIAHSVEKRILPRRVDAVAEQGATVGKINLDDAPKHSV